MSSDGLSSHGASSDAVIGDAAGVEVDETIDFERRRTITPEQMQFLVSINHTFARSVSGRLSTLLEADIRISMMTAERLLYCDYLARCGADAMYFGEAEFASAAGALTCIDRRIVDAAIHLSLGGKPDIPEFVKVREATALDAAVIDVFLDAIWAELNRMWASCEMVAKYKTEVPGSRLAKVFPESEELMTFTYGIKIEKIEGKLQVALPSAVAGVLLREMDRKDVGRAASPEARQMLCERLATTQHVAYLRLPQFRMSMAQLLNLEPGSIVSSGLPESTMAQFSIGGGPVWNSPLARRGVRLVAQIGE